MMFVSMILILSLWFCVVPSFSSIVLSSSWLHHGYGDDGKDKDENDANSDDDKNCHGS